MIKKSKTNEKTNIGDPETHPHDGFLGAYDDPPSVEMSCHKRRKRTAYSPCASWYV